MPAWMAGWWLERDDPVCQLFTVSKKSTFKTRMMTIYRSYVLITLMHMMFTRTSRNEGRLSHMVVVTFVGVLHDLCALCELH